MKFTKDNDFNTFIKQFSEMKIIFAETVNKLEKLEESNKINKILQSCKNCQNTSYDMRNCHQPYKICKRN